MKDKIDFSNENIKYNIFLIGAMKCGTSTIFKHLENHPEICMCQIKEPEYFSINMGYPKFKKGKYLDLFPINHTHKFTFDGSTGYSKFPAEKDVPKRIFEAKLKPRFIYIVRNPFNRIESHYNYMQKDLNWKGNITSDHLINTSNYQLQLNQYLKYFDKSTILVLDFDELISNQKDILNKIYNFLDISHKIYATDNIQNNKTKLVNTTELRLKKKLNGGFKWVPKGLKQYLKDIFFVKKRRQLTTKQKEKVKVFLEKDILQFGKDYNIDVSKWGF